jgi:sodium pump decarboxylase gamma subunit
MSLTQLPTMLAMQDGNLTEGFALMVVGMLVVFLSLTVLAGVVLGIGRLLQPPAPAPMPAASTPAPIPAASEGIDPHHLVAIAAAVAVVVDRPHRLRHVVPVGHHGDGWVTEGRVSIMTSHRPHLSKQRSPVRPLGKGGA